MATPFLLSRTMKVAICNALEINHERYPVKDVSVSLVSNEVATISVQFILTKEIIKLISEDLNAENKS